MTLINLTTLGRLELSSTAGHSLQAILVQPKRIALLAYLGVSATQGFRSRDILLAMFWPDLDSDRARNSLNKAVHFLRMDLGEGVLIGRGDRELGLDPDRFSCDVTLFETALEKGKAAEAMRLYGGDLLPGFFLSGAPEFERWLDQERGRLRRRAAGAAGGLAGEELERGNSAAAIAWARRALDLAPAEESPLRRLLTMLDSSGDRVGASQAFDEWTARLRQEHGLEPSPETIRLIDDIRRRAVLTARAGAQRSEGVTAAPAPDSLPPAPPPGSPPAAAARRRSRLGPVVGLVLPAILAMLWGVTRSGRHRDTAGVTADRQLLIVPFRTVGADPSLAFLGEGVVDLLAARLNGAGGMRVVDPYVAVSAWRHRPVAVAGEEAAAIAVAAGQGAGYAITGGVLGGPERLTVEATILGVVDGHQLGAASVAGPADSLLVMIDRLAVELLSRRAGAGDERFSTMRAEPLSAVRAYLDGMAAYRRGQYDSAVSSLSQALRVDSGFSLAAFDLMLAANLLPDPDSYARGKRLAWKTRKGLDAVDLVVLRAFAGPEYPRPGYEYDRLIRLDSAATLAPDRPDLWFMLGDNLYHFGSLLEIEDHASRATAAFEKALALDPEYEAPLEHLVDLAATAGDTRRLRPLADRYLTLHPLSEHADYVRWRVALALENETELHRLRSRFDSMSPASLQRIAGVAQIDGVAMPDAVRALDAVKLQAASMDQRRDYWTGVQRLDYFLARNLGHQREAERDLETLFREDPRVPFPGVYIVNAMFLEGRKDKADSAARAHRDDLSRPPTGTAPTGGRLLLPCLAARWMMARGDTAAAERIRRQMEQAFRDGPNDGDEDPGRVCLSGLESQLGLARRDPASAELLRTFESTVASVSGSTLPYLSFASLDLARQLEASGNLAGALRAVRRRQYHWIPGGIAGLSSYLLDEGRMAERAGDSVGAIRTYRHFLTLRYAPDPELVLQADSVRSALARLTPHH